jgi:TonB-linked SusC/RagA family outer membrane protein
MRQTRSPRGWLATTASVLALALTAFPSAAQQPTGVTGVTGRVTDVRTGQPVPLVQVQIPGTNLGHVTSSDGRYTVRGVPTGEQRVRILRVGYAEQVKTVTVTAGQLATLDFTIEAVSIQLAPVVTTATGEQRRVEVGNAISQVDAAKVVETAPIANINDLLNTRAAGVQVLGSGATGTGARVRIRGTNSLSLSNDPVYVVDGVRVEASSTGVRAQAIGLGGSLTSRLNDLNPEEIENIEVVRGPSAATLYGTDAANGVIVITTKKGRVGRPQWSFYAERGIVEDRNTYPDNYTAWGRTANGTVTTACYLTSALSGACTRDSVTRWQPLANDETTFLSTGNRTQLGGQISGGTEAVRYFASGEFEGETGVMELPDFDRARLNAAGAKIPEYQDRPNELQRQTGRANLNMAPTQQLDIAVSTGYTHNRQRLPNLDNNLFSPIAQALFGSGYRTQTTTSTGATLNGYRNFTPADIFEESYQQAVDRVISSANTNWRPMSWLAARGNFGLDFTSARDTDICRYANCPDNGQTRLGYALDDRRQIWQYTVDVGGTASFQPFATFGTKTSVGVQYFRNELSRERGTGTQLPPGATQPAAGAIPAVNSTSDETRTLGAYIEEAVSWRERVFVTGALRYDDNSAFGADFSGVVYPKASISWVLSDESFFPQWSALNSFRIRSALGQSGVRPGTNDALQFYAAGPAEVARLAGVDIPGVAISALGNPDLKPETTTEFEGGIDVEMLNRRLNVELTYYSKKSRDALIARVLPPSQGTGNAVVAQTRFENLGAVTNKGAEAIITAQLLTGRRLGWDMTVTASTNSNKLIDMGGVPPQVGATVRQTAGYPLNGYWQRKYTYADANNDGIIASSELAVDDSATFVGPSMAKLELVLSNGIELFNRRLRVQALADFKGGHHLYNNTSRFQCTDARNCKGRTDPNATLFEQARSVAATEHPARTLYGFMEKADFVRLREVSLQYTAPERFANLLRARALSATLSARNLGFWSDYTGIDPESTYGQTDIPADFLTLAPASYFTLRLNARF